jgi:hypothetical protein
MKVKVRNKKEKGGVGLKEKKKKRPYTVVDVFLFFLPLAYNCVDVDVTQDADWKCYSHLSFPGQLFNHTLLFQLLGIFRS